MDHHSHQYEALVLRTYDVGEADRYCIFLTKERGRIAARASGVRRPMSRMGGSLLPFQHVTVSLKESSAGYIVAGVEHRASVLSSDLTAFSQAEQGIELLLALTEDEEPLPEVSDATLRFLQACGKTPAVALGYTLCLLHLLGFLPEEENWQGAKTLTQPDREFLHAALATRFTHPLPSPSTLRNLCRRLVHDQLQIGLKAEGVAGKLG